MVGREGWSKNTSRKIGDSVVESAWRRKARDKGPDMASASGSESEDYSVSRKRNFPRLWEERKSWGDRG